MRALTVIPGQAGSAEVRDVPDPEPAAGELLVQGLALGICGTDREIVAGEYGAAPEGEGRLVLGHESFGRVLRAPDGAAFSEGDHVVGVVRRPDPVPCGACARGEFDMCRNGRFTERGIKERHGYGSERWTVEADYAVGLAPELEEVGVLMEPTTVVAKAWDQIERIGARAWFEPRRVLVCGAGPIGLLAALLGVQRGLEVHVLDRVTGGPKPELVEALGGTYHHSSIEDICAVAPPDVVIEATGVPQLVMDAISSNASAGIVCLTGVSAPGHQVQVDGGRLNRELVLENDLVFGSVNANLHHFRLAAEALGAADRAWLGRLITRRVPLERFAEALDVREDDVKVVLALAGDE